MFVGTQEVLQSGKALIRGVSRLEHLDFVVCKSVCVKAFSNNLDEFRKRHARSVLRRFSGPACVAQPRPQPGLRNEVNIGAWRHAAQRVEQNCDAGRRARAVGVLRDVERTDGPVVRRPMAAKITGRPLDRNSVGPEPRLGVVGAGTGRTEQRRQERNQHAHSRVRMERHAHERSVIGGAPNLLPTTVSYFTAECTARFAAVQDDSHALPWRARYLPPARELFDTAALDRRRHSIVLKKICRSDQWIAACGQIAQF